MTELETKLYSLEPRDIAIIVGDVPVLLDEDVGIVLDASSGWRTVVRSDDAPTVVVAGRTKVPQAALQIAALVLRLTGDRVQVLKDRDGDATTPPSTVVPVPLGAVRRRAPCSMGGRSSAPCSGRRSKS